MNSVIALGVSASSLLGGGSDDIIRGAIIGALIVGMAFLAGFAVLRRGSAAACALLMVFSAGALELAALGFLQQPAPAIVVLLQGVFAASVLFFLSATIKTARHNAVLGGVMFAAALSLVGLGVLNIVLTENLASAMRMGLYGVGAFTIILSAYEAFRRDAGAQLILPGAIIAVAGPLAAMTFGGGGSSLAPHALFTFGVLTASLVSLAEGLTPRISGWPLETPAAPTGVQQSAGAHRAPSKDELLRVSENQLAQVLDYSGVAVWDWTPQAAHQTESFGRLMGAAGNEIFTPDALRSFVHKSDLGKLEGNVLGASEGDGGFNIVLRLHNGDQVRMRGARAIDDAGEIERLVVFLEPASEPRKSAAQPAADARNLAAATAAGAAAGAALKKDAAADSAKPAETKTAAPNTDDNKKSDAPKLDDALRAAANGQRADHRRADDQRADDRRADGESDRRKPIASMPELAGHVTAAINKNKLEAAFQPIVDLKTEEIVGYEALVRWPDRASDAPAASPEEIVRAAQAAGKGKELARMMLTAAAAFLGKQLKSKKNGAPFVAMNVSVANILENGFVEDVRKAISSNKLPPNALVLELTEAEQIVDVSKSAAVFEKLKKAGAALAFDDFGAGFSSLSNLQKFSFDYLKIDKSFIGELTAGGGDEDGGAGKIVASVASLGNDLGMKVIAEGVESEAAAQAARDMGCHYGQGFLYGGAELEGVKGGVRPGRKQSAKSAADAGDAGKRGWKSIWSNGLR